MSGILFRSFSVVVTVIFFADPALGVPPSPADSLKIRPPYDLKGTIRPGKTEGVETEAHSKTGP